MLSQKQIDHLSKKVIGFFNTFKKIKTYLPYSSDFPDVLEYVGLWTSCVSISQKQKNVCLKAEITEHPMFIACAVILVFVNISSLSCVYYNAKIVWRCVKFMNYNKTQDLKETYSCTLSVKRAAHCVFALQIVSSLVWIIFVESYLYGKHVVDVWSEGSKTNARIIKTKYDHVMPCVYVFLIACLPLEFTHVSVRALKHSLREELIGRMGFNNFTEFDPYDTDGKERVMNNLQHYN